MDLIRKLQKLRDTRKSQKLGKKRSSGPTAAARKLIFAKTGGRCHICGAELSFRNFQADHVKSYTMGGQHTIDNYLPACSTCNNYRWHYSPEEIQLVLKLGVWLRGQMINETPIGIDAAQGFMIAENKRELRRKPIK